MMNNILTSGGLSTMSFSTICIFREYAPERSFPNQQNAMANFKPFECIVVCTMTGCINTDRSFINNLAF